MRKSFFHFIRVIPLVLLLCFAFSCRQQATEEIPEGIIEAEAKTITDGILEVWNAGNLALVDELYASGYIRHYVDIYEDIVGIDAYKKWITDTRTSFPDFHVTLEDEIITGGDKIVARWVVDGTNTGPLGTPAGVLPPTGKKIRFFGSMIVHIVNGKIVEEWLYFNQASSLQQLGFTITPPAPPEEKK